MRKGQEKIRNQLSSLHPQPQGGSALKGCSAYAYMKQKTDLERKLERFEKEQRKKLKNIVRDTRELHRFMKNLKVASSFDVESRVMFRKSVGHGRTRLVASGGCRVSGGETGPLTTQIRRRSSCSRAEDDEERRRGCHSSNPSLSKYSRHTIVSGHIAVEERNMEGEGKNRPRPQRFNCVETVGSFSESFSKRSHRRCSTGTPASREWRSIGVSRLASKKCLVKLPECKRTPNPDNQMFDDDSRAGSRQYQEGAEALESSTPNDAGKFCTKTSPTKVKMRRFRKESSEAISGVESLATERKRNTTRVGNIPKNERESALNKNRRNFVSRVHKAPALQDGTGLANVAEDVSAMSMYCSIDLVSRANLWCGQNTPATDEIAFVQERGDQPEKWSVPEVADQYPEIPAEKVESDNILNDISHDISTDTDNKVFIKRKWVSPSASSTKILHEVSDGSRGVDGSSKACALISAFTGSESKTSCSDTLNGRAQSSKVPSSNTASSRLSPETNPLMTGQRTNGISMEQPAAFRKTSSPNTCTSTVGHWLPRSLSRARDWGHVMAVREHKSPLRHSLRNDPEHYQRISDISGGRVGKSPERFSRE